MKKNSTKKLVNKFQSIYLITYKAYNLYIHSNKYIYIITLFIEYIITKSVFNYIIEIFFFEIICIIYKKCQCMTFILLYNFYYL
jgi:hypothetical protein